MSCIQSFQCKNKFVDVFIFRSMGGHRSELACRIRWGEMCETKARESRAGVGSWSAEEDEKLKSLVGVFGFKWAQVHYF